MLAYKLTGAVAKYLSNIWILQKKVQWVFLSFSGLGLGELKYLVYEMKVLKYYLILIQCQLT